MCAFFSNLIIWELHFKFQTSFEAQNSVLLLSLSLDSSSPTFKLLFMTSYGSELLLDSSSPWSGVSNHLFSFFIPLSFIFKKQKTPLMKKIQGLQAPHGATLFSPLKFVECFFESFGSCFWLFEWIICGSFLSSKEWKKTI